MGPESFLSGMQSSLSSKQRFMRARGGYAKGQVGGAAETSAFNHRPGVEWSSGGLQSTAERKDKTLKALRFIRKFQHLY